MICQVYYLRIEIGPVKMTPKMTATGARNGRLSTPNLQHLCSTTILHLPRILVTPELMLLALDFNEFLPVSTHGQNDAVTELNLDSIENVIRLSS